MKAPVYQEPQGFTTAEIIEFNLLAARDERLSPEIRGQALFAAAFDVAFASGDVREFAATLSEAAALETMPPDSQASCTFQALNALLRLGRTSLAAEIATKPAFENLKAELRSDFERAHRALVIAEKGDENWEKASWTVLTEKKLERFSIGVAERIVRQLAYRGEYARAEQLISNAKDVPLDAATSLTSSALRLEWTRLVRNIRDHGELLAYLRKRVNELPESSSNRTERVQNRLGLNKPVGLTDAERIALVAQILETGTGLPESTRQLLWVLGSSASFGEKYPAFFPDLLEVSLGSTAPDAVKSTFVSLAALSSDIDRPEVLLRVGKLLEDFSRSAGSASLPQTQQSVATARAIHALRTSRKKQPDALFDPAQIASLPFSGRSNLQLRFHFARGQTTEALQLVQTLGADDLTQPEIFVIARSTLLHADRRNEVELLDDSMRAVIGQRMPEFWLTPDSVVGGYWFEAAEALGSPELFTTAWFERAIASSEAISGKGALRLYQAWLAKDWSAMRAAADAVFEETPEVYDLYYPRALARHRLHDDDGARAHLKTFLRHSFSSGNYQSALMLFQKLSPDESWELPQ